MFCRFSQDFRIDLVTEISQYTWCSEIGSLMSPMHVIQVHPVMSENQFHCTRLYIHNCVQQDMHASPSMFAPSCDTSFAEFGYCRSWQFTLISLAVQKSA